MPHSAQPLSYFSALRTHLFSERPELGTLKYDSSHRVSFDDYQAFPNNDTFVSAKLNCANWVQCEEYQSANMLMSIYCLLGRLMRDFLYPVTLYQSSATPNNMGHSSINLWLSVFEQTINFERTLQFTVIS